MTEREFLELIRQALLMAVDAIERKLHYADTTANIRRQWRQLRNSGDGD